MICFAVCSVRLAVRPPRSRALRAERPNRSARFGLGCVSASGALKSPLSIFVWRNAMTDSEWNLFTMKRNADALNEELILFDLFIWDFFRRPFVLAYCCHVFVNRWLVLTCLFAVSTLFVRSVCLWR